MEILNTGSMLMDKYELLCIIWIVCGIIGCVCIFGLSDSEFLGWKGMLLGVVCFVISCITINYQFQDNHYITTYDVILTDKSYYELIEEYDILHTKGKIFHVIEKGAND